MSHENPLNVQPIAADQKERFTRIMELIAKAPPAATAQEAHTLVTQSFQMVERPLRLSRQIKHSMVTGLFPKMEKIRINGRRVLFEVHIKHILFIGENGAIDIRRNSDTDRVTESVLKKDPSRARTMEKTLAKPGSDGQGVWEETTS